MPLVTIGTSLVRQLSNSYGIISQGLYYIAGYITKKLLKKSTCELCWKILSDDQVSVGIEYTNLLSRGGLRLPTNSFATYVCRSFAKLDLAKERLLLQPNRVRKAAEVALRRDSGIQKFMCEEHFHWGMAAVNKTVTNIYFNNKQAITNDSVRKR